MLPEGGNVQYHQMILTSPEEGKGLTHLHQGLDSELKGEELKFFHSRSPVK